VGGTTLRDFTAADGQPGYFRIQLAVYGRAGEPCPACGRPLLGRTIGQRNSVYCGHCQH
ncbi:MAG: zinc finger domain-containing protein, partial [Thiohalospira sp.]